MSSWCCFIVCGLSKAQADMARQGEDVAGTAAVDRDDAFKNLAKTLNVLLERLEKMTTGNVIHCCCNIS